MTSLPATKSINAGFMLVCPMRRPHSCGWIDVRCGFTAGIRDEVCHACSKLGVHTLEASAYRTKVVEITLDGVRRDGTSIPHVQRVMKARGTPVADRKPTFTHWPFPRWKSWANEWDGLAFPVAVWRGVADPVKRSWRDLSAKWKGKDCGCGGCGCWRPAKRAVLFVMDMVHPLQSGRRVG